MAASDIVLLVWFCGWLICGLIAAYAADEDDWFPAVAVMVLWPLLIALAPLYALFASVNRLGEARRRRRVESGAS
jgi:hypothetical protein